jgi:hypothetical protein
MKKAARGRPFSDAVQHHCLGASSFFLAASVALFAASSADWEPGDGAGVVAELSPAAGAAGAGAGVAGGGAGAGVTAAGGGVTTAGADSSFLPHAASATAAVNEAIRTDFLITGLLWMKVSKKKF